MTQRAFERSHRPSPLVVCADSTGARFTLPLGSVVRFMEVSASALVPHPENRKAGMYAVKDDEGLLPVVHVTPATAGGLPTPETAVAPSERPARWSVLTYVHREQEVGIMVDAIVDVVDSPLSGGGGKGSTPTDYLAFVNGQRMAVLSVSTLASQAYVAA
jgi:hypothetical protein